MTTRHTNVRIPIDLWADIREAADRERRSGSQWVRIALEAAVERARADEKQKKDTTND